MTAPADDPARHRRGWFFRGFRDRYALRYVRKHFHAVRLAKGSSPVPTDDRPLIVVLNHPGWWDPMIGTVLSREFGERREHFAAIDANMLKKYPFFKLLGFVGVDTHSLRGAAEFLRTATALLSRPHRALWVTAQGQFSDVRTRPLGLRAGVGHLAARLGHGLILPVALEYTFWTERTPEALARIGPPVDVGETKTDGRGWTARIERALTETLDGLNADAMTRDPDRFVTLLGGATGVGGLYDGFRRLRAWATGRRFEPAHAAPGGEP
jgi:1-acyl-sn-glycerol-3-phosphate acyltransferase